jgi:hypothetical protein
MYGEVHANRVFYKPRPSAGSRYKNIAIIEKGQFEVRIFEGDVLQTDPQFIANSSDAEIYFHPNLQSAIADADKESQACKADGWVPYTPYL